MKSVWITWEVQRRNKGISSALGVPLHELVVDWQRIPRYIYSIHKTIKILRGERPELVIAQNPSIVLAILTVLLRSIFKYKVFIDAHNSGIYPSEGRSYALKIISKWLQRKADLTIVTNQDLKAVVEVNGGKAFVLPDRLPQVPQKEVLPLGEGFNVVFICTYNVDEPYEEVFKAAEMVSEDIMIYVTGNHKDKIDPRSVPPNVELTGFVPDETYWMLLSSADTIMVLTLRESCLMCGAYEAVSLIKPLILSDTRALKEYFDEGCLYVTPDAASIANGIIEARRDVNNLKSSVKKLNERLHQSWQETLETLKSIIETLN